MHKKPTFNTGTQIENDNAVAIACFTPEEIQQQKDLWVTNDVDPLYQMTSKQGLVVKTTTKDSFQLADVGRCGGTVVCGIWINRDLKFYKGIDEVYKLLQKKLFKTVLQDNFNKVLQQFLFTKLTKVVLHESPVFDLKLAHKLKKRLGFFGIHRFIINKINDNKLTMRVDNYFCGYREMRGNDPDLQHVLVNLEEEKLKPFSQRKKTVAYSMIVTAEGRNDAVILKINGLIVRVYDKRIFEHMPFFGKKYEGRYDIDRAKQIEDLVPRNSDNGAAIYKLIKRFRLTRQGYYMKLNGTFKKHYKYLDGFVDFPVKPNEFVTNSNNLLILTKKNINKSLDSNPTFLKCFQAVAWQYKQFRKFKRMGSLEEKYISNDATKKSTISMVQELIIRMHDSRYIKNEKAVLIAIELIPYFQTIVFRSFYIEKLANKETYIKYQVTEFDLNGFFTAIVAVKEGIKKERSRSGLVIEDYRLARLFINGLINIMAMQADSYQSKNDWYTKISVVTVLSLVTKEKLKIFIEDILKREGGLLNISQKTRIGYIISCLQESNDTSTVYPIAKIVLRKFIETGQVDCFSCWDQVIRLINKTSQLTNNVEKTINTHIINIIYGFKRIYSKVQDIEEIMQDLFHKIGGELDIQSKKMSGLSSSPLSCLAHSLLYIKKMAVFLKSPEANMIDIIIDYLIGKNAVVKGNKEDFKVIMTQLHGSLRKGSEVKQVCLQISEMYSNGDLSESDSSTLANIWKSFSQNSAEFYNKQKITKLLQIYLKYIANFYLRLNSFVNENTQAFERVEFMKERGLFVEKDLKRYDWLKLASGGHVKKFAESRKQAPLIIFNELITIVTKDIHNTRAELLTKRIEIIAASINVYSMRDWPDTHSMVKNIMLNSCVLGHGPFNISSNKKIMVGYKILNLLSIFTNLIVLNEDNMSIEKLYEQHSGNKFFKLNLCLCNLLEKDRQTARLILAMQFLQPQRSNYSYLEIFKVYQSKLKSQSNQMVVEYVKIFCTRGYIIENGDEPLNSYVDFFVGLKKYKTMTINGWRDLAMDLLKKLYDLSHNKDKQYYVMFFIEYLLGLTNILENSLLKFNSHNKKFYISSHSKAKPKNTKWAEDLLIQTKALEYLEQRMLTNENEFERQFLRVFFKSLESKGVKYRLQQK